MKTNSMRTILCSGLVFSMAAMSNSGHASEDIQDQTLQDQGYEKCQENILKLIPNLGEAHSKQFIRSLLKDKNTVFSECAVKFDDFYPELAALHPDHKIAFPMIQQMQLRFFTVDPSPRSETIVNHKIAYGFNQVMRQSVQIETYRSMVRAAIDENDPDSDEFKVGKIKLLPITD